MYLVFTFPMRRSDSFWLDTFIIIWKVHWVSIVYLAMSIKMLSSRIWDTFHINVPMGKSVLKHVKCLPRSLSVVLWGPVMHRFPPLMRQLKIDCMFYLSSRVHFARKSTKNTQFFIFEFFFTVCVVVFRARIAFPKEIEVKHTIYFELPNAENWIWPPD